MKITPLRRTIRHLAQRLRMEGETFMKYSLLGVAIRATKGLIILFVFQFVHTISAVLQSLEDSQEEGVSFGNGNCMFKMCRQSSICRNNRPFIRQDAGFVRPNQNHGFKRNGHPSP